MTPKWFAPCVIAVFCAVIIFVALAFQELTKEKRSCAAAGGVLVTVKNGSLCIDRNAIINIK